MGSMLTFIIDKVQSKQSTLGPQFRLGGPVIAGILSRHDETGSLQLKRSICREMIAFVWIIGRTILSLCTPKSSGFPIKTDDYPDVMAGPGTRNQERSRIYLRYPVIECIRSKMLPTSIVL